jgi:hypothetical protein
LFVEAGPPSICVCSYSTVDVIKQRNMVNSGVRWKEACYGGTDVMERSCAVARGKDINSAQAGGWGPNTGLNGF